MKLFRWNRKPKIMQCEICRIEFEPLYKQPTIDFLLERVQRGSEMSLLFVCGSCGKTYCVSCLVPLNPKLAGAIKSADSAKGTHLCPGCRNNAVEVFRAAFPAIK